MSNSRRGRRTMARASIKMSWARIRQDQYSRMLMPTYCEHQQVDAHTDACLEPQRRTFGRYGDFTRTPVYDGNGMLMGFSQSYEFYDEIQDWPEEKTSYDDIHGKLAKFYPKKP